MSIYGLSARSSKLNPVANSKSLIISYEGEYDDATSKTLAKVKCAFDLGDERHFYLRSRFLQRILRWRNLDERVDWCLWLFEHA